MNQKNQDKIKEDIMQYLGLNKLSQDKQDEILAKIGEIILKKIFIETVDKLGETDRAEFEKMLKEGTDADSIEKFLNTKIENYDMIISRIVEEVKNDIKNS
ncbi:MAG: hypothetical protein UR66_C0004G0014 [Candidatus Moranbacteria bacterium GW2011_GWE1_35_17]|nr:MAG: hypothetical protein UR66_C0004G0014 [Candidatus Moranbacteria bacterium GW2011_GWE1_35_17]